MIKSFPERFWSKVDRTGDCWLWRGAQFQSGYGFVRVKHIGEGTAHRVAWVLWHGRAIPSGMFLCHHCDTRLCCNPSHIFVGTPADNTADMWSKGRARPPFGENHWKHKLTEAQVLEASQKPYTATARQFADRFHVSKRCIESVRNGYRWRYLLPHLQLKAAA